MSYVCVRPTFIAVFALAICFFGVKQVRASTVAVNCNSGQTIQSTLAKLNPAGPNTLTVSGTCNENVTIQGMDRLTLIATGGATINDASGAAGDVIDILSSHTITVQGFTINGGSVGILCAQQSACVTKSNTVQGAAFAGLAVYENSGLMSFQDVIQNNAIGILVQFAGYFETQQTIVQNNTSFGIEALLDSSLRLLGAKIVGNTGDGVHIDQHSAARLGLVTGTPANIIQKNGGNGVYVGDLSFVRFTPENRITGNITQPDVACYLQYSATRGALSNSGGGTTNCAEPGP